MTAYRAFAFAFRRANVRAAETFFLTSRARDFESAEVADSIRVPGGAGAGVRVDSVWCMVRFECIARV